MRLDMLEKVRCAVKVTPVLLALLFGCAGGTPSGETLSGVLPVRCENSGFVARHHRVSGPGELIIASGDGLFRSEDFGRHFSLLRADTPEDVVFFDDERALASFPEGVEATTDGGLTWSPVATEALEKVQLDERHGLHCRGGVLHSSSDGGASHRNLGRDCSGFKLSLETTNFQNVLLHTWGESRIYGYPPTTDVSFDGGVTRRMLPLPQGWAWGVWSLRAVGPGKSVALFSGDIESVGCGCAAAPRLALTKDGGESWVEVPDWKYQVNEMHVDDEGVLWLSVYGGDGARSEGVRVKPGDARIVRVANWDTNVEIFALDGNERQFGLLSQLEVSKGTLRFVAEHYGVEHRDYTLCEAGEGIRASSPKVFETKEPEAGTLALVSRRTMASEATPWLAVSPQGRVVTKQGGGMSVEHPSRGMYDEAWYALLPGQPGIDYLPKSGPVWWMEEGRLRFVLSSTDGRPALLYEMRTGTREATLVQSLISDFEPRKLSRFGSMLFMGGRQGMKQLTRVFDGPAFLNHADPLPMGSVTPDGWFVALSGTDGVFRQSLFVGSRPGYCSPDSRGTDCLFLAPELEDVEATSEGWTCGRTKAREFWCTRFGEHQVPPWKAVTGLRHPGGFVLVPRTHAPPRLYFVDDDVFALDLEPGLTLSRSAP